MHGQSVAYRIVALATDALDPRSHATRRDENLAFASTLPSPFVWALFL